MGEGVETGTVGLFEAPVAFDLLTELPPGPAPTLPFMGDTPLLAKHKGSIIEDY